MRKLFILSMMIISICSYGQDKQAVYKNALIDHNKKVISYFYDALEDKNYEGVKSIFDLNGKAIYARKTNVTSEMAIEGREAIGERFKLSLDNFSKVRYSTDLYVSTDPCIITVKVRDEVHTTEGSKTKSNYLATFKLKDGKIIEYKEFNDGCSDSLTKSVKTI